MPWRCQGRETVESNEHVLLSCSRATRTIALGRSIVEADVVANIARVVAMLQVCMLVAVLDCQPTPAVHLVSRPLGAVRPEHASGVRPVAIVQAALTCQCGCRAAQAIEGVSRQG